MGLVMLGLAYAAVPLYRMFCQQTGFAGTPKIAQGSQNGDVLDQEVTVRFDASVHRDLPWIFRPGEVQRTVKIGQVAQTFFRAKNLSDKPIVGMATFNVTPDSAAPYFNKVACFCFEQQRLEPGQEMNMPVLFFISPDMVKDRAAKDLKTITLSYTFFVFKK